MLRRLLLAFAVFVFAGACVLAAGFAVEPESGVRVVTPESACPVAGCAADECHDYDDVPEPNGLNEMKCPELGCASVECHAWETLRGGYRQASDASLNVWILAPVVLVLSLVLLVGALSRPKREASDDFD